MNQIPNFRLMMTFKEKHQNWIKSTVEPVADLDIDLGGGRGLDVVGEGGGFVLLAPPTSFLG